MSYTYSGNPADSQINEVRFLIGDTNMDPDEVMLHDEEIAYALALYPATSPNQPLAAAVMCAEAIWSYFCRQANENLPPVNFEYSKRAETYEKRLNGLKTKMAVSGGLVPYVGGISRTDHDINTYNSDRWPPLFKDRDFDNKATVSATLPNLLDWE